MKTIAIILSVLLVACAHTTAPTAPTPIVNQGCQYAHTLDKSAPCLIVSTSVAGKPDVAIVDFGRVLAYCHAGEGMGSACAPFADLRPRDKAKEEAPAPSSPAPAPTTDAKPKADPPKKPEAKKP